jgi:hypothetical protein
MGEDRAWIKAFTFAVLLVGTLTFAHLYFEGGLTGVFRRIGLLSSQWHGPDSLIWCPTRVIEGELLPNGFRMTQEGREWAIYRPARAVISFVEAEKWFAEHCELAVEHLAPTPLLALPRTPVLNLKYVDVQITTLYQLSPDIFEWNGQYYRSQQISSALSSLAQLIDGDARP